VIGLPGSGRSTWAVRNSQQPYHFIDKANCYINNDEDSICCISKYPELFFSDGSINNNKILMAIEWCKNKVELLFNKNEQVVTVLIEPIGLQLVKKYMELASSYKYSIEIHTPSFGYLFYPNKLLESEQINNMRLRKCDFQIKNQVFYTEDKFTSIIRDFNTILNFISNNLEEFDDEFDQFNPNDWIDKINNNFQLHKPKTPIPRNPSPRNKKFI
jgi:hypothetical protein